jgi:hypothetical protein
VLPATTTSRGGAGGFQPLKSKIATSDVVYEVARGQSMREDSTALLPMSAVFTDVGCCRSSRQCWLLSPMTSAMSAAVSDVGCRRADQRCYVSYCRRCLMSAILSLSLVSPMPVPLVRCLLSEIDAAGHTNALETPLLPSHVILLMSGLINALLSIADYPHAWHCHCQSPAPPAPPAPVGWSQYQRHRRASLWSAPLHSSCSSKTPVQGQCTG